MLSTLTCLSAGTCTVAGGSFSATSFSLGLPGDRDVDCASDDVVFSFDDVGSSPGGTGFSLDDAGLSFDDVVLNRDDEDLSFPLGRSSVVSFILTRFFRSVVPSKELGEGIVCVEGDDFAPSALSGHE